jgi:hypothetical protein
MNDWISTKNKLPETNNKVDNYTYCSDEVLMCLNDNRVIIGRFYKFDYANLTYWISTHEYKYSKDLVTHWMNIVLP